MSLPLYDVVRQTPPNLTSDGHHGLWFDRFFDQYEADFSISKSKRLEGKDQSPRTFWLIESFVKNKQSIGNVTALTHYINQQSQLIEALNGQQQVFKASWHFVTGMGNPHPVENGFTWHPTLGVPYLTGAAVKGLVRSYLENNYNGEQLEKLLWVWFGSTNKGPQNHTEEYPAQSGALIFFDAIPTKSVQLGVDIMTPHMGDWYAKGASEPNQAKTVPADWHDPVPVSFLVAKDITLLFSFAVRTAAPEAKAIELEQVSYVLEQALQYAGAGAKTATGYGAFVIPPAEQCAWVDESIKLFAKEDRVPEHKLDDVLFGKKLALAWKALEDEALKQKALVDIKVRWQAKGMWDEPQGKAKKEAKKIYQS